MIFISRYNFEDESDIFGKTLPFEKVDKDTKEILTTEDVREGIVSNGIASNDIVSNDEMFNKIQKVVKKDIDILDEFEPEHYTKDKNLEKKATYSDPFSHKQTNFNQYKLLAVLALTLIASMYIGFFAMNAFTDNIMGDINENDTSSNITTNLENDFNLNDGAENLVVQLEDNVFVGVLKDISTDGNITFYDILNYQNVTKMFDDNAMFRNSIGSPISRSSLNVGDIVEITEDSETNLITLKQDIGFNLNSVNPTSVSSIEKTIQVNNTYYYYYDETTFTSNGKTIAASSVSSADTLNLYGYKNGLWNVEVLKSHGFISLTNVEQVENLSIRIDGSLVSYDSEIPLPVGTHSIIITGDNITTISETTLISANDFYYITIPIIEEVIEEVVEVEEVEVIIPEEVLEEEIVEEVVEEVVEEIKEELSHETTVNIDVNVSGFNLYINEIPHSSTGSLVLDYGPYTFKFEKDGYKSFEQNVYLDSKTKTISAVLEKIIVEPEPEPEIKEEIVEPEIVVPTSANYTVVTDPSYSNIFIDGKLMGQAPITFELSFGKHTVSAEHEGYKSFSRDIVYSGENNTYVITLTEE